MTTTTTAYAHLALAGLVNAAAAVCCRCSSMRLWCQVLKASARHVSGHKPKGLARYTNHANSKQPDGTATRTAKLVVLGTQYVCLLRVHLHRVNAMVKCWQLQLHTSNSNSACATLCKDVRHTREPNAKHMMCIKVTDTSKRRTVL